MCFRRPSKIPPPATTKCDLIALAGELTGGVVALVASHINNNTSCDIIRKTRLPRTVVNSSIAQLHKANLLCKTPLLQLRAVHVSEIRMRLPPASQAVVFPRLLSEYKPVVAGSTRSHLRARKISAARQRRAARDVCRNRPKRADGNAAGVPAVAAASACPGQDADGGCKRAKLAV